MECRGCKGAINAVLNPKRTKQQLHESSVRRRIADLFLEGENEFVEIEELFKRFDSKCFKTKKVLDIKDRGSWHIDHIVPSKWLYPLKVENAALLSTEANSAKKAKWPSKFYSNNELIELARITGGNLKLFTAENPIINKDIDVNKGVERYLQVREKSDLPKRIKEIKKILQFYKLVDSLSDENKKLLGFI
jgi:CRISPR/Cas system Type II protein with McrA/HNH and RuvC-like nuclease domain